MQRVLKRLAVQDQAHEANQCRGTGLRNVSNDTPNLDLDQHPTH